MAGTEITTGTDIITGMVDIGTITTHGTITTIIHQQDTIPHGIRTGVFRSATDPQNTTELPQGMFPGLNRLSSVTK